MNVELEIALKWTEGKIQAKNDIFLFEKGEDYV